MRTDCCKAVDKKPPHRLSQARMTDHFIPSPAGMGRDSLANWSGDGAELTPLQKALSMCQWGTPAQAETPLPTWKGWGPIQIADQISDGEEVTIQLRWVELEAANNTGTENMGNMVEQGSKYSDEDRRAAALSYAIHGNVQKVSRSLDIPATTLYDWRNSEWWESVSIEVRSEKQDEIVAGLGRIVDKAISETEDRLENGDVYVHQGQITRAPVKAKDAVLIGAVAIDKAQLLQNKPTSISGKSKQENIGDLIKKFDAISRAYRASVVSEQ